MHISNFQPIIQTFTINLYEQNQNMDSIELGLFNE